MKEMIKSIYSTEKEISTTFKESLLEPQMEICKKTMRKSHKKNDSRSKLAITTKD